METMSKANPKTTNIVERREYKRSKPFATGNLSLSLKRSIMGSTVCIMHST